MTIAIGLKGRADDTVTPENTAAVVGSGTLPVYATPCLCALMERAAWSSIAPYLDAGDSSVGTKLELFHRSASPVGIRVWAESEVVSVEGRKIEFQIRAYDERCLIAECNHQRFIVSDSPFLDKANRKLEE